MTLTDSAAARGLTDVTGDLRLALSLATADGWRADLGEGARVPFTVAGGTATATASVAVDPVGAAQLMARHAAEVGTVPGSATLTVTPVLEATAVVAGRPVGPSALAPFSLAFDGAVLRPNGGPEALAPSAASSVTVQETGPRQLALPGFPVPLRVARLVVALLLAAVGLGWLVAVRLGRPDTGAGAAGDVLVRFAGRLVPVSSLTTSATVVDVDDADALHRIAQRLDCLVLHHRGAGEHTFAVQDQETTYRLRVPAAPQQPVHDRLLQPA